MAQFEVVEAATGHHWVMVRGNMVVAAGASGSRAEVEQQVEAIMTGRAPPQLLQRRGGWAWAFVDEAGELLGVGLRRHQDLDACLDECILSLLPEQLGRECAHPMRA